MRSIKKYIPRNPRADNRPPALASDLQFDIQGFDELAKDIRVLSDDKVKRREILKILKRQMKSIEAGIKAETPVAEKPIEFRGKIYPVGNLKRSISTRNAKSKQPTVITGPNQGKKVKYDGFYAWWHIYGWSPFYKRGTVPPKMVKPNDFIWRGAVSKIPATETTMTNQLKNYIGKKAKTI